MEQPPSNLHKEGADPTKQLLQWLYKNKSSRLTLRANTKGKNRFVWRQFRLAYVDDVDQPYAMCVDCQTFVKYSGRTGTGGLVRHYCFRQVIAAMDPPENAAPIELPKAASPSPTRVEVEELVSINSPRIGYVPNYKGKSNVWAQFDIITVDNLTVNFAACKICRSIVTYVSRTGTGSMARHRCQMHKRGLSPEDSIMPEDLAKRVKQEWDERPDTPPDNLSRASIAQMHQLNAFSQMLQTNLETFRKDPTSPPPAPDKSPQPEPEPERASPEDVVRRDYVQMLRRSLDMFHSMRNDQFFSFAQALVNLGSEYGKIDIRQLLSDSTDMDAVFNDID